MQNIASFTFSTTSALPEGLFAGLHPADRIRNATNKVLSILESMIPSAYFFGSPFEKIDLRTQIADFRSQI
jgi:hypothetical protein